MMNNDKLKELYGADDKDYCNFLKNRGILPHSVLIRTFSDLQLLKTRQLDVREIYRAEKNTENLENMENLLSLIDSKIESKEQSLDKWFGLFISSTQDLKVSAQEVTDPTMTKAPKSIEDLFVFARNWGIVRGLHLVPFSLHDLQNNIKEEKKEYITAKTDDEKIDAIIDEIIYIFVDSIKDKTYREETQYRKLLLEALTSTYLMLYRATEGNPLPYIYEVMKEISSRRGEYDPNLGKWVKKDSVSPYVADFQSIRNNKV